MKILSLVPQAIRSLFPFGVQAAGLPEIVPPKVKRGAQAAPSHMKRSAGGKGDTKLAETDRNTARLDVLTLRNQATTKDTIRQMSKVSPDLSASVNAYVRMAVTRHFTAVARNQDGTANPEATQMCQALLNRLNFLQDYTDGFSGMSGIHAIGEALTKELRIEGSCALELVLDKALMPNRLQPISTSQLSFYADSSGYAYPVQKAPDGTEINLDTPAFFYESLDQDLTTAYSDSPMEAGVSAAVADAEFTNDVRRIIKRAIHPRLDVEIDVELFRKMMPPEVRDDPSKEEQFIETYVRNVTDEVNGLEPDDALVHFDNIKFDYLNNGNISLNREYETLQNMVNAKLATGTKAPPAVLGHGSGSQNIASTETMLFVRYCEGVQNKVNSIISRALTLGMRLLGHDVFVKFEFERIDLRPDSELEAFRVMRQSRVLELLSLGLVSDEDAAIELTGNLPPAGAPKLSGTNFRGGNSQVNPNPLSNTANSTPQDMNPQTPTQAKSQNRKKEAQK